MPNYNRFQVVGHLGRDPERKTTQSGKDMVSGSIAYSDGKDKPTLWVNWLAFGKTGEYLTEARKGEAVLLDGRLVCDEWNDKATGEKRTAIKMMVDKVVKLSVRGGERAPQQPSTGANDGAFVRPKFAERADGHGPVADEELPF